MVASQKGKGKRGAPVYTDRPGPVAETSRGTTRIGSSIWLNSNSPVQKTLQGRFNSF